LKKIGKVGIDVMPPEMRSAPASSSGICVTLSGMRRLLTQALVRHDDQ
jgi:hypothetical protein